MLLRLGFLVYMSTFLIVPFIVIWVAELIFAVVPNPDYNQSVGSQIRTECYQDYARGGISDCVDYDDNPAEIRRFYGDTLYGLFIIGGVVTAWGVLPKAQRKFGDLVRGPLFPS